MRPNWKECLTDICARLADEPQVLIASDFDGTLSPLVERPEGAALSPEAPQVLAGLAALQPRVRLAFLSGRRLDDLAQRLGDAHGRAFLGGNHGLELRGDDWSWTHPAAISARPHLDSLAAGLQRSLGQFAGVELEDKGTSLTLHYRRVAAADRSRLQAVVNALGLPAALRRHEGKMVFEFRPRVEWNKGFAMRHILRHLGLPDAATVYLGDDSTDEDVFRKLDVTAITVHVGSAAAPSRARLNANDPADAVGFLKALVSCLDGSGSRTSSQPQPLQ